jgi:serine/threonine-protein kinase
VLAVGQILDERYEILAPLAEGGMGAVYRARRVLLGDEVAIKIVRADNTGPGPVERFMRESRACAQIRHPNIVTIFDFNADDQDRPFLVMELLSGPSLKQELAARGAMTLDEVQAIVPPICSALQLAHDRTIVHRDLKPANIVAHDFTSHDRVYKVVDFGLANIRDTTETRLTAAHQFIGTLSYASPEQLTGASVDFRSDIYSLGAVVYELLTGRVPFGGDDVRTVLTGHLTVPAPKPSAVRPEVPSWVDDAVLRALEKRPEDRWSDIGEFGLALGGEGRRVSTTTTTAAAPHLGLENLLSIYELGERLGPGRLGSEVYHGTHRALGHPVAIRVLRGGGERAAAIRARFLTEARTLQIAHPSIINVRDYGESGDAVYVVTDFIDGPRLREVISSSAPLPWARLKPLVGQLAEAAHVLHRLEVRRAQRKGLVSGLTPDIMLVKPATSEEPERLMISTSGIWDARDLLATLSEQTLRGIDLADKELRYVAPEILTGRPADTQSDIFTIGVLAYEMATGRLPYDGRSMPDLLGHMLRGAPEDIRLPAPTLPETAAVAIMRAINPSSEQRFATVKEFVADLCGEEL